MRVELTDVSTPKSQPAMLTPPSQTALACAAIEARSAPLNAMCADDDDVAAAAWTAKRQRLRRFGNGRQTVHGGHAELFIGCDMAAVDSRS